MKTDKITKTSLILTAVKSFSPQLRFARYIAAKLSLDYSYVVMLLGRAELQGKVKKQKKGNKVFWEVIEPTLAKSEVNDAKTP